MQKNAKKLLARKVVTSELMGFAVVIIVIWLDEIIDIPFLFLGAQATVVNWRESLFETLIILPLALALVYYTHMVFRRMKYLEGFLPICASCKMIRDEQDNWQEVETYIHARSEAHFSHGICPNCAKKLYPDLFTDTELPSASIKK